MAVSKRFGEHDGSRLAATVSYYSFFSVFPLLLALVTVLGIVLDDRPDLRDDLVDGALGQIPVIGSQLADAQQPLDGSGWVRRARPGHRHLGRAWAPSAPCSRRSTSCGTRRCTVARRSS